MKFEQQIPRNALVWMIFAQFVLLLPHLWRVPLWVLGVYLLSALWRTMVYQGRWSFPGRWLKTVLGISCFAGIYFSYGTLLGLEPTVALLMTAFALKLIELAERKDAYLLIFLAYFVCLTEFLFSQELHVTLYMIFAVLVITSALVALHQHGEHRFTSASLRRAAVMLAQSFPLMLVLFFVFPRIGPLWSVPIKSHAAKSGMSDFMSPGDVSDLSLSGDVAFRVQFKGDIPPTEDLYWRGLVFSVLEGERWRSLRWGEVPAQERRVRKPENFYGRLADYSVILEPTQQNFLYALRYAEASDAGVMTTNAYTLYSPMPVQDQLLYQVQSWLDVDVQPELTDWWRETETRLPEDGNPRTRELAASLFAEQGRDSAAMAERVLNLFREGQYYYTLQPALLGDDGMDDFLFNTREGFCEHYATAFVYMMRSVGVPARVIGGYQGGEVSSVNGTVLVHQFDAHAWAEVWLPEAGWTRIDPTAAIAPNRIRFGLQQALQDQSSFLAGSPLSPLRYRNIEIINLIRLRLDALNYGWQRFVLEYDRIEQYNLLQGLLGQVSPLRIALLIGAAWALVLIPASIVLLLRGRAPRLDPATRLYHSLCSKLERVGLHRAAAEAPGAFAQRVAQERPDLAAAVQSITSLYETLTYRSIDRPEGLKLMRKQVARFRPGVA